MTIGGRISVRRPLASYTRVGGVALAMAVGLTLCPPAFGDTGSVKTITYRNVSPYGEEVAAAAKAWSSVGIRLRIVPARPGHSADITIVNYPFGRSWTIGQADGPTLRLRKGMGRQGGEPLQRVMGYVAAHEFGHEIGLAHTALGRCSLMSPWGDDGRELKGCKVAPGYVPCGPQQMDVRAAARIWGWRPGGKLISERPGFGSCLVAHGPTGADPTISMCPMAVPLVGDDEALLSHFYPVSAESPYQAQCEYLLQRTHKKAWYVIFDLWTQSGYFLGGFIPAAGNCDGPGAASETTLPGVGRFVTVRASETDLAPPPEQGFTAFLQPILTAAEAAGVGLACTSAQG